MKLKTKLEHSFEDRSIPVGPVWLYYYMGILVNTYDRHKDL